MIPKFDCGSFGNLRLLFGGRLADLQKESHKPEVRWPRKFLHAPVQCNGRSLVPLSTVTHEANFELNLSVPCTFFVRVGLQCRPRQNGAIG